MAVQADDALTRVALRPKVRSMAADTDNTKTEKDTPRLHPKELQQREQNERLAAAMFELNQAIFITTAVHGQNEHPVSSLLHLLSIDIRKELQDLGASHDQAENRRVAERIHQWLGGLTQYGMIPLAVHIRLLKNLEPYVDAMPHDMQVSVLRAFKAGILHIREKAVHDKGLFGELVHIIAATVTLSVNLLYDELAQHLSPSEMNTRQTFEITRLGLVVARTLPHEESSSDVRLLKQAIIHHELLRRIDMFSLTDRQQQIVRKRLKKFAAYADVEYMAKGKPITSSGHEAYLISKTEEPRSKPLLIPQLTETQAEDAMLLISIGQLQEKITDMTRGVPIAERLLFEVADSHLENDAGSFLLCAVILADALKNHTRRSQRKNAPSDRMIRVRPAFVRTSGFFSSDPEELFREWRAMNESPHDLMMEGKHKPFPVTSLIELDLGEQRVFGLIRWYRATLQGDVRTGVQLLNSTMIPADIRRMHFSSVHSRAKYWPSLLENTAQGWNVWLGNWHGIPVPMTVGIKRPQQAELVCRITPSRMIGVNYAVFTLSEIFHEVGGQRADSTTSNHPERVIELPDIPEEKPTETTPEPEQ